MSIKGFSIGGEVQKYDYNSLDNLPQDTGLTEAAKTALLNCFANVAWINANGQTYYDALEAALQTATAYTVTNTLTGCTTSNDATTVYEGRSYSATITASSGYTLTGASVSITMGGTSVTGYYNNGTISIPNVTGNLVITVTATSEVSSISAVFTQGQNEIHTDDSLDVLRQYLVVTATYADTTTGTVTDYTLSGSLAELGTTTITASYGGKSDTFQVVVSEYWTYSISDLTKKKGALVAAESANCKVALSTTTDYRRSFLRSSGITSVAIQQNGSITAQTSEYYPIKVPAGAVSASVSITPNTQYVAVYLYSLTDGVYTGESSSGDSGYVQGTHTKTFSAAPDNYYLLISTKYNSAGTSYSTEPTGLDISFS